jgi:hypothetical protein
VSGGVLGIAPDSPWCSWPRFFVYPERGPRTSNALLHPRRIDVALLIDRENLKLSLRDHFGVSPNIDSLLDAASA